MTSRCRPSTSPRAPSTGNGTTASAPAVSNLPCFFTGPNPYGNGWGKHALGYLGIDVGPIAPMIENSRTEFCWKTFMKAPEIQPVIKQLARQQPAGAVVP
ncbi:MAG: hypothetical protein NTW87_10470 [Planctomycetota bacterium]|nr:hypothetical protein [Planctomycetota bacterium]